MNQAIFVEGNKKYGLTLEKLTGNDGYCGNDYLYNFVTPSATSHKTKINHKECTKFTKKKCNSSATKTSAGWRTRRIK